MKKYRLNTKKFAEFIISVLGSAGLLGLGFWMLINIPNYSTVLMR